MNINKLNLIPLSLASLTILAGTFLVSSIVSADDSVVDEINITVPVSCTISGTGMNTHNANISNGLYVPDIGTTTLHAFCNDNEGFAIYAAGYTGNEVGGENSNKLVGTNASNNATIESGIATTAGNPDISNWAMKLAISQDSGDTTGTNAFTIDSAPNVDLPSEAESGATQASFSSYHVVPNEYVKVAHKNSATDMTESTGGVKLTTTYAAYISKTQAADTYSGQVIYTLVHPASAEAPEIPFSCNPNGTTIGTNSRTDIKCMQDISSANKSSVLASMATGTQYTLVDNRDYKSYFLAKQVDGNIWMTQNLDLCIGCEGTEPITSENTDLKVSGTTMYTDGYSEGGEAIIWTPVWVRNNDLTPYWVEGGEIYVYTSDEDELETTYYSLADCEEAHSDGTCPHFHIGNYYNWNAAVATNNSHTPPYYATNAENSICPAGWRLPNRTSNDTSAPFEFTQLLYDAEIIDNNTTGQIGYYVDDGFSRMRAAPFFFVRAGEESNISLINSSGMTHAWGFYQSAIADYYLIFNQNTVRVTHVNDEGSTWIPIPVRCMVSGE